MKSKRRQLRLVNRAAAKSYYIQCAGFGLIHLLVIIVFLVPSFGVQASSQSGRANESGDVSSEVISLYNQGITLLRANRSQEAVSKFRDCCALSPQYASGQRQWAIALLKMGQCSEAIEHLNQATGLEPTCAANWLSLGAACQAAGRTSDATSAYGEFVRRFPTDADIGRVRKLITLLKNDGNQAASEATSRSAVTTGPGASMGQGLANTSDFLPPTAPKFVQAKSDDYLRDVTSSGLIRWSQRRMPLAVFIQKGDAIASYRSVYSPLLKDAFLKWAEASGGRIGFVFVGDPKNADIVCTWTSNAQKFANAAEPAETRLFGDQQGLARGEIEILTVTDSKNPLTANDQMHVIALHEVGHVLGLAGHSPMASDIMFKLSDSLNWPRELSIRDKNTIVRLYETK